MPIIIVPENRSALYSPNDDVRQRPKPIQPDVEKPRLRRRNMPVNLSIKNVPEQIREAFRMAGRLAIEIIAVDHLETIDLAAQARLTTYDASYLWLARKTGGELVSLDKRLLKASGR